MKPHFMSLLMMTHCHQPSNSYSISLSHFRRHGMSLYSYTSWNCSLTGSASQILYPCFDSQLPSQLCDTSKTWDLQEETQSSPCSRETAKPGPSALQRQEAHWTKAAALPLGQPWEGSAVSPAYLHCGKALLRPVLDGAPAALSQVPSPVLGLWLHHNLQLLPLTLSRVLTTQHWGLLPSSSLLVLWCSGKSKHTIKKMLEAVPQ